MHGVHILEKRLSHALLYHLPVCNLGAVYLVLLHRDDREQCTVPDGPVPLHVVPDRLEDEHAHQQRRLQVLSVTKTSSAVSSPIRLLPRTPRAVRFAGADP